MQSIILERSGCSDSFPHLRCALQVMRGMLHSSAVLRSSFPIMQVLSNFQHEQHIFRAFHLFRQVLPIVYASHCPCFSLFASPKEKTGKAVHFVCFAAASDPVMLCIPVGGKYPLGIWLNIWSFWAELLYFKSFCKGYLRWMTSSKACCAVHFTFRPV